MRPLATAPNDPAARLDAPLSRQPRPTQRLAVGDPADDAAAVAATDGRLDWVDLATGQAWSTHTLSGPAFSLHLATLPTTALLVGVGSSIHAWDAPQGADLYPGLPTPTARREPGDFSPRMKHDARITAAAATTGDRPCVATGDALGRVLIWDPRRGRRTGATDERSSRVAALAVALPADAPTLDPAPIVAAVYAEVEAVELLRFSPAGVAETTTITAEKSGSFQALEFAQRTAGADPPGLDLVASTAKAVFVWRDVLSASATAKDVSQDGTEKKPVQCFACGFDGDSSAVLYVRADGALRISPVVSPAPVVIGAGPADAAAVGFFQLDADTHLAAVASHAAALRVWKRMRVAGAWLDWLPTDVTIALGQTPSSVRFGRVVRRPVLIVGVATDVETTTFKAFDVLSGEAIGAARAPGATGASPVCLSDWPAPHAAAATEDSSAVKVVDLRTGAVRATVEHAGAGRIARLVPVGSRTLLYTAADGELRVWDAATGQAIVAEPYTAAGAVGLLETHGGRVLMAGDVCRVWIPTLDSPFPSDAAATLPIGPGAARAAALGLDRLKRGSLMNDEERPVALIAVGLDEPEADQLEVWDLEPTVARRGRIALGDHVIALACATRPDGLHAVVAGQANGTAVWSLPGAAPPPDVPPDGDEPTEGDEPAEAGEPTTSDERTATLRWRLARTAAPTGGLGVIDAAGATRVLLGDSQALETWELFDVQRLDSRGVVRAHVQVELPPAARHGLGFALLGTVTQAGAATFDVRLRDDAGRLQRLLPAAPHRGVFGFVADLPMPGALAGRSIVSVWRDDVGQLGLSRLTEEVVHTIVNIVARNPANQPVVQTASADLVRMNLDVVPSTGARSQRTIVAGRVQAAGDEAFQLTLHLGEHDVAAPGPRKLLAHLEAKWNETVGSERRTVVVQGPVQLTVDWAAQPPTFELTTGVYRLTRVQVDARSSSAPRDVVLPTESGVAAYDLVGTQPAVGQEPSFVRLSALPAGLRLDAVAAEQIPVDACFDGSVVQSLAGQPEEVLQLLHRQAAGRRLRYRQSDATLLSTNELDARWLPADAGSSWLLAPVLQEGRTVRVYQQTLMIAPSDKRDDEPATDQTENVGVIALPADGSVEMRAISGLHSATGEGGFDGLLSPRAIAEAVNGVAARGVLFHRLLVAGGPAVFRLIAREGSDFLPPAAASDPLAASAATVVDVRHLTPSEAARGRLSVEGYYLPTPASYRPELDVGRRPTRRVRLADVTRALTPPRVMGSEQVGLFVSERTAFHRLAPGGACPPQAVFAAAPNSAPGEAWFHPAALELGFSPDKPGAAMHHRFQGLSVLHPAPQEPLQTATSPTAALTLRDPLLLDPPLGADLEIETATRDSIAARQAERIHVAWKETLASLDIRLDALPDGQLPLVQLPPNPGPPADLKVGFEPQSFLQCFLRINDELFEVTSDEARFPVYDARLAATESRPLTAADEAFPTGHVPQLDEPAIALDAVVGPQGGVVLASGAKKLKAWRLTDPRAPLMELHFPEEAPAAALASYKGQVCLLTTVSDGAAGVFLNKLSSPPSRLQELSQATDVHAVAATSGVGVMRDDSNVPVEVSFDAYAAVESVDDDTKFRIWVRHQFIADGAPPASAERDLQGVVCTGPLWCVPVVRRHEPQPDETDPPKFRTTIVVGSLGKRGDQVVFVACEFDLLQPAQKTFVSAVLPAPGALCATLSTIRSQPTEEERPVVYVGAPDGKVTSWDLESGKELQTFTHSQAPVALATASPGTGPILIVATASSGATESAHRVTVWDVVAGRALRFVGQGDADVDRYGVVAPLVLEDGPRLVVAQVTGVGSLQSYELRLSSVVPPDIFLASRLRNLLADAPVDVSYRIGDEAPVTESVVFSAYLVQEDRKRPEVVYRTKLVHIFHPLFKDGETPPGGVFLWKYGPPAPTAPPGEVDLRWDVAGKLRLVWEGKLDAGSAPDQPLRASVFEPLPAKAIAPIPYSAVAPKLAAVALVDEQRGAEVVSPVMQRTLLFGDAAAAASGRGVVQRDTTDLTVERYRFAYELNDNETVDLPVPRPTDGQVKIGLLLLKYLATGETLAAGVAEVKPRSR